MASLLSRMAQPLTPPIETLKTYNFKKCWADILAGITVAVIEIPQGMAYALIAGVPPEYGLYTAIIQGFFGSLFASNEFVSNGPTNTQALLIAATVMRLADPGDTAMYLQLVVGLCLLKGIIQLIFAAARMGNLIRYVSPTGKSLVSCAASGCARRCASCRWVARRQHVLLLLLLLRSFSLVFSR